MTTSYQPIDPAALTNGMMVMNCREDGNPIAHQILADGFEFWLCDPTETCRIQFLGTTAEQASAALTGWTSA